MSGTEGPGAFSSCPVRLVKLAMRDVWSKRRNLGRGVSSSPNLSSWRGVAFSALGGRHPAVPPALATKASTSARIASSVSFAGESAS